MQDIIRIEVIDTIHCYMFYDYGICANFDISVMEDDNVKFEELANYHNFEEMKYKISLESNRINKSVNMTLK